MSLTCGLITVEATPGKEAGKEPIQRKHAACVTRDYICKLSAVAYNLHKL